MYKPIGVIIMVMENYPAINYKDSPSTDTPVSAGNLNKTDGQVKNLTDVVRNIQTALESSQVETEVAGLKTLVTSLSNGKADKVSTIPLPAIANEGDHLRYRGGKWVAEASETT